MADEAIVLVGGLGTRLRAVVSDVPKPLAPVAGRPFVGWMLDLLAGCGIRRTILAAGYMADRVEATLGRQWQGMALDYSIEDQPLGTGGAIRKASTMLHGDGGVHVVNGDTFLRYQPGALEQAVHRAGASLGIALARVPDVARYGAVDVRDGAVVAFREKGSHGPGLINAGCYYLGDDALRALPDKAGFSFETEVLAPQVGRGIAVLEQTADFIDIGVPDDYFRVQAQWGAGE